MYAGISAGIIPVQAQEKEITHFFVTKLCDLWKLRYSSASTSTKISKWCLLNTMLIKI